MLERTSFSPGVGYLWARNGTVTAVFYRIWNRAQNTPLMIIWFLNGREFAWDNLYLFVSNLSLDVIPLLQVQHTKWAWSSPRKLATVCSVFASQDLRPRNLPESHAAHIIVLRWSSRIYSTQQVIRWGHLSLAFCTGNIYQGMCYLCRSVDLGLSTLLIFGILRWYETGY